MEVTSAIRSYFSPMDKLAIARVTKLAGRRARFLTDCSSAGGEITSISEEEQLMAKVFREN